MNNLKTKVNHLDIRTLKTAPIDLKILIDAVDNEAAQKTQLTSKDESK